MNNESVQPADPNSGSGVSKAQSQCRVIFFRTFNLADFFDKPSSDDTSSSNNSVPLAFLKQRTAELSRCLFTHKKAGQDIPPLHKDSWWSEQSTNWKFSARNKNEEDQAYAAGWVRRTLLDAFFAPTYEYKKPGEKGVFGIIPSDPSCERVCSIYREHWFQDVKVPDWLDEAHLFLTLSAYGIVSVKLQICIPIDESLLGQGTGAEFRKVQTEVIRLFYSSTAEHKLKADPEYKEADDYPSLLSFIALSAIWNFVDELRKGVYSTAESRQGPSNSYLKKWWKDLTGPKSGSLNFEDFSKVWKRCIQRPFPLRHEAAYYYFEHARYEQPSKVGEKAEKATEDEKVPTPADLDCIIRLGLLVFPHETSGEQSQDLFAEDFRQHLEKTDLCVTDNGYAFMVGNSLIVAAKDETYRIQGSEVKERAYWRWMFRLLCCLRECFMLCDISSRDVRKLREQYEDEAERAKCLKDGEEPTPEKLKPSEKESRRLLDELARVASLLFTVEEGTHAVASSRVQFVQEKFRTFIDHMGLSDLLENVSKRRQRLEQRLHDEMSRLLQGHMEELAEATEATAKEAEKVGKKAHRVGWGAFIFAILATFFAGWSLILAIELDHHAGNLDTNVKTIVEKYLRPIGQLPTRLC